MERKGHVAAALLMATIGVGAAGLISNPVIVMALLCFAQIGISAVPPMFWPLPASFLTGASAAAGIAAINSLGNLSGFAGPYAMGYLKDLTGNFTAGLLLRATSRWRIRGGVNRSGTATRNCAPRPAVNRTSPKDLRARYDRPRSRLRLARRSVTLRPAVE
jgi:hypothetical protein